MGVSKEKTEIGTGGGVDGMAERLARSAIFFLGAILITIENSRSSAAM